MKWVLYFIATFPTLFIFCQKSYSQFDQRWQYYYPEFSIEAKDNLYFRIENNNFVKNNEYFGDYTEGYTFMGYAIQPSFMYYAGDKLRIKGGLHLLHFSGMGEFTEVLPVFSIHAKLTKRLDLIMGGLRGDVHHRLIEPVFNPEHQYTRPVENGFQLLFQSQRLWFDGWVDWEQFITIGDNKPEKFTAGISSEFRLTAPESFWNVSLPIQMIATHLGGQISDYSESMQSLANLVGGVKIARQIPSKFFKQIGISTYLASYKDLTQQSGWDFHSGHAIYPTADLEYKYGNLMVGYWQATNFLAPKGNALFQSVSDYKTGYYTKNRQLVTAKLNFSKTFLKQIKFNVMAETYYDPAASQLEYSYGMNLVFTPNFFITRISYF